MRKAKSVMVVCVAGLLLAAVAAEPVSAKTAGWMVNGTLLTGSQKLANTAAITPFSAEAPESGIQVKCNSKTMTAVNPEIIAPEKGGVSSIAFNGCEAIKPAGCTLEGTSVTTVPLLLTELTLDGTLAVKGVVRPETKNTFFTFIFLGVSCALSGQQAVTSASGLPFLSPERQDERTVQKILFNDAGRIKIGSEELKAHFTILNQLANDESWSFL